MANVNGVLIIDKPAGMTSHDVVARVRKIIGERRAGHTGTLDPFATGVLVVLIGRATRLAQFLSGAEKEYEAVVRLGYATDTGDIMGTPLHSQFPAKAQSTQRLRKEEIESGLASLQGEIVQTPPMYSAKKIAGKKLYELARRGQEIERRPVRVTIKDFEIIQKDDRLLKENEDGTRDLAVRVVCSAGTYVRTLAESFGERLGVGAHVAQLRRTRAGQFTIERSIKLEQLSDITASGSITESLITANDALSFLPFVDMGSEDVTRTLNGIDLKIKDAAISKLDHRQPVRMRDETGNLIAVGKVDASRSVIHPSVVIANC